MSKFKQLIRWLRPDEPQVTAVIEDSESKWYFNDVPTAKRWAEANKNYWPLTIYDENGDYVTCYTE